MFKKEKWLYLSAFIVFIWNLIYILVTNILGLPNDIRWSNIFFTNEKISAVRVLLLPVVAFLISLVGIMVSVILNYKKSTAPTNKYVLPIIVSLTIINIVPLMLTFYSQIALANFYDNDNFIFIFNGIWMPSILIWMVGLIITSLILINIIAYSLNYNTNFRYSFNQETNINDLKKATIKNNENSFDEIALTKYHHDGSSVENHLPNLNATVNISSLQDSLFSVENDAPENVNVNHYEMPQVLATQEIDDASLIEVAPTIMMNPYGFTQQIKNEYERDFNLVQELHRINMAQSDVKIAKLVDIFYNRYEKGLDLDIDRVMILIYRVALKYEVLDSYLKDAILYKLDRKFISDLARKWFEQYCEKVNNLYATSRYAFKKTLNEGIVMMENDIEKYLQETTKKN